jgi:hypothetical protein
MVGLIWDARGVIFVAFLKDNINKYNIYFVGIQEVVLTTFSCGFLRKLSRCGNFKWH